MTPSTRKEIFISLLERALTEEMGLIFEVTDQDSVKNHIKEIRKETDKYNSLVLCSTSNATTMALVKESVSLDFFDPPQEPLP